MELLRDENAGAREDAAGVKEVFRGPYYSTLIH